jgi:hypothetical protein
MIMPINVIVRSHIDGTPDELAVMPINDAFRQVAIAANCRPACPGEPEAWLAIPPAGSDWERAEWDDLAHRAGVA